MTVFHKDAEQASSKVVFLRSDSLIIFLDKHIANCTVSVLGREEGYTVKYGLSPRAIPRAQALFYGISRLES